MSGLKNSSLGALKHVSICSRSSKLGNRPTTVTQKEQGDETLFDLYHGSNDPQEKIPHLRNIASD
jgi:hypothetical protein